MSYFTRILDKAILNVTDAKFSWENGKKHSRHAHELELTPKQYRNRAQELSEATPGGNIVAYTRKDGRKAKLDKSTREYVVYKGNSVITFYKLNESQYERALRGEY